MYLTFLFTRGRINFSLKSSMPRYYHGHWPRFKITAINNIIILIKHDNSIKHIVTLVITTSEQGPPGSQHDWIDWSVIERCTYVWAGAVRNKPLDWSAMNNRTVISLLNMNNQNLWWGRIRITVSVILDILTQSMTFTASLVPDKTCYLSKLESDVPIILQNANIFFFFNLLHFLIVQQINVFLLLLRFLLDP